MIRVLQVVTQMNRGGLETMLMNYHRNIDRKQVQFDYLVHRKTPGLYDEEIISLGGKIYRLPNLNPFSITYRKEIDKFFKEHPEYTIVHSHINCLSAIPLFYARKNGVKVRVSHSHISDNQKLSLKNLIKLYYRNKLPLFTTKQFACGQRAGKWLYQNDNFEVIPNAIDAKRFRYNPDLANKMKKELGLENQFVIGHVGRFNIQKNQIFIVSIFSEILKSCPESKLILVGDGEEKKKVREKVAEMGIEEKVEFLGIRADVENVMQAMDVFLMPSLFEGLPVTMIEAQASGLPCVISECVSSECIITEHVKVCSLKKNKEEWAEVVLSYLGQDRQDSYQKIIDAKYDIEENAKYLQEFYLHESGTR